METQEEIKSLEERVKDVLNTCYDPEIPVNIFELGLIYEIKVNEGNDIHVRMTLTSPACPVAETLPVEVEQKIKAIPDVNSAKVEITFDPPWNQSMLTIRQVQATGYFSAVWSGWSGFNHWGSAGYWNRHTFVPCTL